MCRVSCKTVILLQYGFYHVKLSSTFCIGHELNSQTLEVTCTDSIGICKSLMNVNDGVPIKMVI